MRPAELAQSAVLAGPSLQVEDRQVVMFERNRHGVYGGTANLAGTFGNEPGDLFGKLGHVNSYELKTGTLAMLILRAR